MSLFTPRRQAMASGLLLLCRRAGRSLLALVALIGYGLCLADLTLGFSYSVMEPLMRLADPASKNQHSFFQPSLFLFMQTHGAVFSILSMACGALFVGLAMRGKWSFYSPESFSLSSRFLCEPLMEIFYEQFTQLGAMIGARSLRAPWGVHAQLWLFGAGLMPFTLASLVLTLLIDMPLDLLWRLAAVAHAKRASWNQPAPNPGPSLARRLMDSARQAIAGLGNRLVDEGSERHAAAERAALDRQAKKAPSAKRTRRL